MRPRPGPHPKAGRAGFTLIELLAVIMILSILAYFLLTNVFASRTMVEVEATRATLAQIAAALSEIEQDSGDWAPSSFPAEWGQAPNATNLGAECLYLVLCADGAPGEGRFDEQPTNTAGDRSALRIPGHESTALHEIADAWGNPIAYLHHRDYGREDVYLTADPESGEALQSVLKARRNDRTQRWHEPRGFQLVSAGPNGVFDPPQSESDDDITLFKR